MAEPSIPVSDVRAKHRTATGRHVWVVRITPDEAVGCQRIPASTARVAITGWVGKPPQYLFPWTGGQPESALLARDLTDRRIVRKGKKKDMLPPREGHPRYRRFNGEAATGTA
jgi:hypothetical protein